MRHSAEADHVSTAKPVRADTSGVRQKPVERVVRLALTRGVSGRTAAVRGEEVDCQVRKRMWLRARATGADGNVLDVLGDGVRFGCYIGRLAKGCLRSVQECRSDVARVSGSTSRARGRLSKSFRVASDIGRLRGQDL